MDWNYPFFSQKEMACRCGCGGLPKPELMDVLVTVRKEFSFPMDVTSGYRCPEYNKKYSGEVSGPHTLGLAVDICISGELAVRLLGVAFQHGLMGLGVNQPQGIAALSKFLHLDWVRPGMSILMPRPYIWNY